MNDDQIRALVEESVARALAEKDIEVASAIGDALRTYADRPVGEKGSPSLQYGVVDAVFDADGWAAVILDGQTESVPIMMLGGLVEGERVAVLLVPPSGSLAIGMVTPMVTPSVTPGSFGTVQIENFFDSSIPSKASLDYLDWVLDGGLTIPPSDILLDLTNPELPIVIDDGYYTFDMGVEGEDVAGVHVGLVFGIMRGADFLLLNITGMELVAGFGYSNGISFSFSYPCLAGDVPFVQNLNDGGSVELSLYGSVKRIT